MKAEAQTSIQTPMQTQTPASTPTNTSPGSEVDTATEYSETLTSLRHYSNLRFAIFSVFAGITAALLAAVYGRDTPLSGRVDIALRLFGVLVTASFWWIEFTLDGYITAFARKAAVLNPRSHLMDRPSLRRRGVPWATMSLHVGTAAFWLLSIAWAV